MAVKIFNIDKQFIGKAKSNNKKIVVQIAPAVRTVFGKSPKKLVGAVRKLGFDVIYDTIFGADVTIVEEANELIHKLKAGGLLTVDHFSIVFLEVLRFSKFWLLQFIGKQYV